MKNIIPIILVFFVSLSRLTSPTSATALSFPSPSGYVNDFASIMDPAQKTALETELKNLKEKTGIEFTVVTVESLSGTTVEDYATRLFENWKIGQKDKDNGLLFLIAPNERKVRFEVGYGLEGTLNDARTGRILDDFVLPEFKQGQMAQGIVSGVEAVIKVLQGEPLPEPSADRSSSDSPDWFYLIFLPLILLQYFGAFLARSKSFWAGGVIGLIAGVILGLLVLHSLLFALGSAVALGLIGLILDYLLSKNYQNLSKSGRSTSFWGSLGGFGRGGSGGFGGFGGGGSGGGGSSRSW